MSGITHYDVLGVRPSATSTEIREAYRSLARDHHPDRAASTGSAVGGRSMPQINEAYRALNDPGRRAVYDASIRGSERLPPRRGPAAPLLRDDPGPSPQVFPSHLGPARFPWRSLMFVGVIACIGVVVLAQFTDPGQPRGPDGLLEVGSCVSIEPNGDAREVACTSDPATDLVVEAFVPFDAKCPTTTIAHRDRQGMGVACIADPMEFTG